jgi:hypothetical protein
MPGGATDRFGYTSNHPLPFPSPPAKLRSTLRNELYAMGQQYATSHRWYGGSIVRGGPTRLLTVAACATLLAGCGGGGSRQDAGEASGSYAVKVVRASFPTTQSIARPTKLALQVRNTGQRAVPDLAVTIDSFDYTSPYPGLADNKRPVWVIERGAGGIANPPVESDEVSPVGGGQTAYVNTWAFGALPAGATRTLSWNVVPVKSGAWTVHYTVAAGLAGKAKAILQHGGPVKGQFAVDIASAPKLTHVNPNTGRVEVGQFPSTP